MLDKFKDLKVFDEAHKLTLLIYRHTKNFPKSETYGLTSQIRRSSSSVAANIVEGSSRGHRKEFLQFLYLAKGSLEETKYHLLLAKDLDYLDVKNYNLLHVQSEIVGKLLTGLINYCKKSLIS